MFAGVGKLLSNFKSYYNEINSATLTGAIDIVVVEQPDGTYQSSPFHVRFGKLGVIRSREKVVYIEINGEPIDLQMKLGNAGEAFFVHDLPEQWEGPDYMATSPIASSPLSDAAAAAIRHSKSEFELNSSNHSQKPLMRRIRHETELSHSSSSSASDLSAGAVPASTRKEQQHSFGFKPINQEEDEMLESGGMFDIEVSDDDKIPMTDLRHGLAKAVSLPLIQESSISRTESWALQNPYHKSSQLHPFSDTDITPLVSPVGSRPHTPKSDTECEYTDRKLSVLEAEQLQQWNWGELPASSQRVTLPVHTVVSNECEPNDTQKDTRSTGLFSFMRTTKSIRHKPEKGGIYLDDINLAEMEPEVAALYFPKSSQQGADSPDCSKILPLTHVISMPDDDAESGNGTSLPRSPELVPVETRSIATPTSESGTMKDHECGLYGDVAMSLCGGVIESYSNVSVDIFKQHIVDYRTLSEKPIDTLQHSDLVIRIGGKYYNWQTGAPMIMAMMCFHQTLPENTLGTLHTMNKKQKAGRGWWIFGGRSTKDPTDVEYAGSRSSTPNGSPKKSATLSQPQNDKHSESGHEADDEKDKDEATLGPLSIDTNCTQSTDPVRVPAEKHYVKTLRLTSAELERLNLHEGENEIEFSVTTSFQGTSRCTAHIYLWKHTDKIIVSDIDGTITKSDVLGQILPMVGRDWSQLGVADLYTKIARNGYKFAYLSARAIGQAQITRDYLQSVKQGELVLPRGPVFLNPSSLINAFHKEVIEKKPEEFKIRCMTDVKSLFSTKDALYAGFGNRINDIYAYRAIGIPKPRIFLIDPSGKVKSDFCETFQTSYANLSDVTDHFFPPLEEVGGESAFHAPSEYSNFTYWREPMPKISLELPE